MSIRFLDVSGKSIERELDVIFPGNKFLHAFDGFVVIVLGTELGTGLVLEDFDVVEREGLQGFSHESFAEVLALPGLKFDRLDFVRSADGQFVIRKGELGLARGHSINGNLHHLPPGKFLRRSTGKEDIGEGGFLLLQKPLALPLFEIVRVDSGLDLVEGGSVGLRLFETLNGYAGGTGSLDFVLDPHFDLLDFCFGSAAFLGVPDFFFHGVSGAECPCTGGTGRGKQ